MYKRYIRKSTSRTGGRVTYKYIQVNGKSRICLHMLKREAKCLLNLLLLLNGNQSLLEYPSFTSHFRSVLISFIFIFFFSNYSDIQVGGFPMLTYSTDSFIGLYKTCKNSSLYARKSVSFLPHFAFALLSVRSNSNSFARYAILTSKRKISPFSSYFTFLKTEYSCHSL